MPTIEPDPVITPSRSFRGRVLRIEAAAWRRATRVDLEGSLGGWLRGAVPPLAGSSVVALLPGLLPGAMRVLIALDLVDAVAAKPWSLDVRHIDCRWADGRHAQGLQRQDETTGRWCREGLWVGGCGDAIGFAVRYRGDRVHRVLINDGSLTGAVLRSVFDASEAAPDLRTGRGLPLHWTRCIDDPGLAHRLAHLALRA